MCEDYFRKQKKLEKIIKDLILKCKKLNKYPTADNQEFIGQILLRLSVLYKKSYFIFYKSLANSLKHELPELNIAEDDGCLKVSDGVEREGIYPIKINYKIKIEDYDMPLNIIIMAGLTEDNLKKFREKLNKILLILEKDEK